MRTSTSFPLKALCWRRYASNFFARTTAGLAEKTAGATAPELEFGLATASEHFRGLLALGPSPTTPFSPRLRKCTAVVRYGGLQLGAAFAPAQSDDGSADALTVRGVCSGASWNAAYGRPESFQLSLTASPTALVASYFHHSASRVGSSSRPYWSSMCFGGEFTYRPNQASGRVRSTTLEVGASLQPAGPDSVLKLKLSTSGRLSSMIGYRFEDMSTIIPSITVCGIAGVELLTGAPKFGLSLVIGNKPDVSRIES